MHARTGEGIILAILAVIGVADKFELSACHNTGMVGGLAALGLLLISVCVSATKRKKRINATAWKARGPKLRAFTL